MRFAAEYVKYVLTENFEDAKTLLLDPLMAIHYAHLIMLAAQGIVSREDARKLRDAHAYSANRAESSSRKRPNPSAMFLGADAPESRI